MASGAPGDTAGSQPWSQAGPAEDQDHLSDSMTAPQGQPPLEFGHPELWEPWISKGKVWEKNLEHIVLLAAKLKRFKMLKHLKGKKCQAPIPGHSWVGKNSPWATRGRKALLIS